MAAILSRHQSVNVKEQYFSNNSVGIISTREADGCISSVLPALRRKLICMFKANIYIVRHV